ncbi:MAG: hypothetical protein ACRET5_18465, partial [Steroidobacteraceae bacterium]
VTVGGKSLRVEASLGISIYGQDGGDNADTLLRIADESMYGMKLLHRRERIGQQADPLTRVEEAAGRCA